MALELISALTALVGTGINIALLVLVVKQLGLLQKQVGDASQAFASEQLRIKRQSTLEHLAATMQHRYSLSTEMPSETDKEAVKAFAEGADANSANGRQIRYYLNYYENLAAGINSGVFDVEIVARTSGTILLRVFDTYRDFIDEFRNATHHPLAYSEMEELAQTLRPLLEDLTYRATAARPPRAA